MWALALALLLPALAPLPAQAQSLAGAVAADAAQKAAAPTPDPYGRDSPRGMAAGLLDAFAKRDYQRAAQYLEPAAGQQGASPDPRIEQARQLQRKLDTAGSLKPLLQLSSDATGVLDDGLPLDQERIGSFNAARGQLPLIARLISPEGATPYWVVSAASLRNLSAATPALTKSALTELLPETLSKVHVAGAPLADWLVLAAYAIGVLVLCWLLSALLLRLLRAVTRRPEDSRGYQFAEAAVPPLTLFIAMVAIWWLTQRLQLSIVARETLTRGTSLVSWVTLVWFLWRLIDAVSELWSASMARGDRRRAMAALVFTRRTAKTLLGGAAFVGVLDTIGVNVTTGLAALGLGGLALALGAQKTIENLVGSVAVIADQPVRVGDFCKVGDVLGTVEDIGMRSTQIRTNARTVVTIPNGAFSSQQIENYSRRDRFLLNPIIRLALDTPPELVRAVLEGIRQVLAEDEHVIEDARVRLIDISASSLDIEIFAYIRTYDFTLSLGMREAVLLKVMERIAAEGARIAYPTQSLLLQRR